MGSTADERVQDYDRVTQASLNGLYVKARELDRGHNERDAPHMMPPGITADAQTGASEADGGWLAADAEAHASTHASDC